MNIAKILKNAPKGTKLYSPIFGEVVLASVNLELEYSIVVITPNKTYCCFTSEGKYFSNYPNSTCVLFPSKENHDWTKFKIELQFSTTYEECCDVLGCGPQISMLLPVNILIK